MALYTTLASLSQTAASNAADGATDAPSTIDQQTNLLASFIAQLRDGNGFTFQLGPRNLLINANGGVNQRAYVSATATTVANQYTVDRWRVVTSGQSLAFTAAAPDSTLTAPAGGLEQVIEGSSVIGGIYTLSWTGTATATVNGSAITSGSNTASLPANTNVTVRFSGGTVLRPQFELGTVATAFERRPLSVELSLCKRYFQYIGLGFNGLVQSGVGYGGATSFAEMRAVPTVVWFADGTTINFTGGAGTLALSTPSAYSLEFNKTASGTGGGRFYVQVSATAEL